MNTYEVLESLQIFLQEKICRKIWFKVPSNDFQDEGYQLTLAHPKVYIQECTEDQQSSLEDFISGAPQIIIRLIQMEESDGPAHYVEEYAIQLFVSIWNPGDHATEIMYPTESMKFETRDEPNSLRPSDSGLRDVIALCDMIKDELRGHQSISPHVEVAHDRGKMIVPLRDETGPADLKPFYCYTVEFTLRTFWPKTGSRRDSLRDGL